MDFETFNREAWAQHADDPGAVARRLDDGAALVQDEAQLGALMNLAHHVHGAHLGAWRDGIAFLDAMARTPRFDAAGPSGQARARYVASLRLCDGDAAVLEPLGASDRIRVAALAGAALAERDTPRASRLLREALALAEATSLPPADPANRALAVTANNLASALEEKPARSADERALMIFAAEAARTYWAIAGTWLETERAEYRLAHTWLRAGDLDRARAHATACLDIVAAHGDVALERLFGWEALGLVERAAGNAQGHAHALARAREALAELDDADRAWCAASVDKLAA